MADSQIERALIEFDLNGLIGEVGQGETSLGADAHGGAAQVKFGARILVGPQTISSGEGTVDDTGNPIVDAAGLHGNISGHVLQASHAARRIRQCDGGENHN